MKQKILIFALTPLLFFSATKSAHCTDQDSQQTAPIRTDFTKIAAPQASGWRNWFYEESSFEVATYINQSLLIRNALESDYGVTVPFDPRDVVNGRKNSVLKNSDRGQPVPGRWCSAVTPVLLSNTVSAVNAMVAPELAFPKGNPDTVRSNASEWLEVAFRDIDVYCKNKDSTFIPALRLFLDDYREALTKRVELAQAERAKAEKEAAAKAEAERAAEIEAIERSNAQTPRLQDLMKTTQKGEEKETARTPGATKEQLLHAIRSGSMDRPRYLMFGVPIDETGNKQVHDLEIARILQVSYGLINIPTDTPKPSGALFQEATTSLDPYVACRSMGNRSPTEPANLAGTLLSLGQFKYASGKEKEDALVEFQQELKRIENYCDADLVSSYKRLVEDVIAALDDDLERKNKEIAVKEKEALAKATALQAQREAEAKAKELHDEAIKAGNLPITTVRDAVIRYNATGGGRLAVSPLLAADGKVYQTVGTLRPGPAGTLLVEVPTRNDLAYVVARKTGSTKFEPGYQLRFNESVTIVGRYVANHSYRTLRGEQRIAPLFEAIVIGPAR